MVIQSPLASDTLLVPDNNNPGIKKRINKILLQIPVRELHNDLLDADPLIGLASVRDCAGNILISDTKLRAMLPPHLRMMSDRYKIMCGCETCIQMYNLQQSYNRFIGYRIKELKDLRNSYNPRTRRGMAAESALSNYQDKVLVGGEPRFKTAKQAMVCSLCAPPDDRFLSLHKVECILGKCVSCPGFDRPIEELTMENDISFHWYDTLPSCSIHNMLPKYPVADDGVRRVQTKSCVECNVEQIRDPNYVRGGFYKRKYLSQKKCGFQEFFSHYYILYLKRYTYHRFLKIILSKSNIEDVRLSRLQPGEVIGSRDYAERLLMKFHMEIQSEHFGQGRDLSIEGNDIKFYPLGETETTSHFYSFLKDSKIQNAATTDKHMDRLIKILKNKNVLKDRLYETTDGCAGQYRSATALWFLSALSAKHNIIIDRTFGAPGHGKGIVDGVNGTDKNLLIRYLARELKQAMDSIAAKEGDGIKDDEKRFAAHSVNEKGKEFSLAEECARLLRIGRSDGVKSFRKSAKKENARGIKHREWLVWKKEDEVSELKYSTVDFKPESIVAGGTFKKRYHVYCCPELGAGRVALRRIPCACVACDSTIRLPWIVGIPSSEQQRFSTVADCRYHKILGARNEWDVVKLAVDHSKANLDDVDAARDDILVSLSSNIAANIEIGGYGAVVTSDPEARDGYWMVEWTSESYTCQETVKRGPKWWTPSGQAVTIPLLNIVMSDVKMDPIDVGRNMPSSSHVNEVQCLEKEALRVEEESHSYIFDEIFRRETLEYETRPEEEEDEESEEEAEAESVAVDRTYHYSFLDSDRTVLGVSNWK
ncbi:hypothetical protein FRACYDRAFT_244336 [Fragilariopsis cylindrus CCMP1102]|uniref:Uncharacterized protein n=1 Tax=Fragilariopsis cylindrus CCMP1102 TaxID=635003 RepID=A0A1E7F1U9_9STRA|nr:hypothetical protein FRACYDRAFT_244336 [Fragilariopsis cylindrus CCMP1102]|eukprot:OEU12086.1 hypothetical protein FRACYDRAFT_244336 [Fragilariopsis cylindrus CCMP1102]